jgi:hypothetical protein
MQPTPKFNPWIPLYPHSLNASHVMNDYYGYGYNSDTIFILPVVH